MAQKIWVRDTSAGVWRALTNQPNVRDTGANLWRPVKRMFVAKVYIPTGQTDFITEWHEVGDWTTPGSAPTGCTIAKHSPTDNTTPLVAWTKITDPGDDRYYFDMRVEIYINGVLSEIQTTAQSNGSVLGGTYSMGDSAYAILYYINSSNGNTGPSTTTSTIILGP